MKTLFDQAKQYIPGGVNSPVRAFTNLGLEPIFVDRANGAHIYDKNGKSYVDFIGSWGPMILGHNDSDVLNAVQNASRKGLSFGTPTELETEMASFICEHINSIEKIRFVSSGTEATMSAIRLARGFTGRNLIVKFEGCYHGHADSLLVKAGSGSLTIGKPSSAGVPPQLAELTVTLDYNDSNGVIDFFEKKGNEVACIIVEPVAGNMNLILPNEDFLPTLRQVCDKHKSLLIFDEVMTGFRVDMGGAQQIYKIKPDLTTFGKIIGGGMPVGAFGGKAEVMEYLAPNGPVYQAGTLSGNPVTLSAGLAVLRKIKRLDVHQELHNKSKKLCSELQKIADKYSIPFTTNFVGGMFGLFFNSAKNISSFKQVATGNFEHFKKFFSTSISSGVYYAPSVYEAGFISIKHDAEVLQYTIDMADRSMSQI